MSDQMTVAAAISVFFERCGLKAAFGVISIHNMPVLDAFNERGNIRFIPARGEAGATSMADAYARTTQHLGVCVTSTGTAAGNAAGALVEALTAGSPLLHVTTQIETPYMDKGLAYIHESTHQLSMLNAISKAAYRVSSVETALSTIREAVSVALTAPAGPVSVEIPVDIQKALVDESTVPEPLSIRVHQPSRSEVEKLADNLARAKRPLLWLGGGARGASHPVRRLVDLGFGVVSSVQGRGTLSEDDPACLGAFASYPEVEEFYASCDAMLVVGSRLRSNETLTYTLRLPKFLYRIDCDPLKEGRCYESEQFVCGDATLTLEALADLLEGKMATDASFMDDLARTRHAAHVRLRKGIGRYSQLVDAIEQMSCEPYNWVRDITLSNSTWGNRKPILRTPNTGIHALGGGIGQGLGMGIGAAIGAAVRDGRKTVCLIGDGGFIMNVGELATAVQEQTDLLIFLMNNGGYGVIKNIQDAAYGGRHCYVDLHTPDYSGLARSMSVSYWKIGHLDQAAEVLKKAYDASGPRIVEFDMNTIGDFAEAFAGPPTRNK